MFQQACPYWSACASSIHRSFLTGETFQRNFWLQTLHLMQSTLFSMTSDAHLLSVQKILFLPDLTMVSQLETDTSSIESCRLAMKELTRSTSTTRPRSTFPSNHFMIEETSSAIPYLPPLERFLVCKNGQQRFQPCCSSRHQHITKLWK
jgi:hypothetical protein